MTTHFVDIGAHKGQAAKVLLGRSLPNVELHLFEPNPVLMGMLFKLFGERNEVFLYEAAFHTSQSVAIMYRPDPTSDSSSLYAEKRTSLGASKIEVQTINGVEFLRSLSPGPIVLFSNCEGSEFDFVPEILDDPKLVERIKLWSVSFHHGQHKIPTMKPLYLKIKEKFEEMGIENRTGHYGRADIAAGKLDAFIDEVVAIGEQDERNEDP